MSEKIPKISVVVPIYGVENYIEKCLISIQEQTFEDFEVLLINDETPDNSMKIAEKFAEKDSRFLIFNKKNGGLSDARNYGIERARGEYIAFIDSDDYIHKDFLDILYHECVDHDADMSYCRFKYCIGKIHLCDILAASKEVMKTRDALNILIKDNFLHSYAWNKLYKTKLFTENHITYPTMYFEDIATSGRVLYHANKIAISDKYLYYYVMRGGSIMNTMNAQKINDYIRSVLIVRNHIQEQGLYPDYRKSVKSFARKMMLVNIYSIFRQHILNWNFRDLGKNLKTNYQMYEYITDDSYQSVPSFPEIPYKIIQPVKKQKKK